MLSVLLLALVPKAHAIWGYAQATSSIGSVLDTIQITQDSQGLNQVRPLQPNGARFGIWLDDDCSFTAELNGSVVFQVDGPATMARELAFDSMTVTCQDSKLLRADSFHGVEAQVQAHTSESYSHVCLDSTSACVYS